LTIIHLFLFRSVDFICLLKAEAARLAAGAELLFNSFELNSLLLNSFELNSAELNISELISAEGALLPKNMSATVSSFSVIALSQKSRSKPHKSTSG